MGFVPHEEPTNEVTDAEVDEIMSKYGGETDGPTEVSLNDAEETETPAAQSAAGQPAAASTQTPSTQVPAKTAQTPTQATPQEQEFEITHNGRVLRAPLSQLIKWAQQGVDYPQKMAELKRKREELSGIESSYKPIDEWVRANPDKWEKLQAVIRAEQNGAGDLPPNHPILQKLGQFESVFNEITNERKQARIKQEDQELDTEIQSIREKYKDLDWAKVDDAGRNREMVVLAHADKHKFKTFKAAFLDLYHDDLLASAETRAREQFAAQKEKQAKTGLLKSSAPEKLNLSKPKKTTKNYPSATEILDELGIT